MIKKLFSLIACTCLALVASPSVQAADKKHDHSHGAHAGHMLEGYIAVADALYKDDFKAAKKAAKGMASHDKDSALAKAAAEIVAAEDMAAAREAFKAMSAAASKVAKPEKDGKYTVMNCPMVKGGGGDWLSADGKVNNPYFGAKMPHCGGPKK